MSSVPFPQSKNHLLSVVDKLNYTQRFNYASRLGRDHKNNPNILELVHDLLKHPDPPVPEMEAEEGFTEILPAQRTSIAKYYNEDQLALAIAVSAGMFQIIKERLTSPSTFFDHLVFSNYIRMKKETMKVDSGMKSPVEYCASDAEVVKAIIDAVPARRRLLIQESIQSKRLRIIELVVPQLLALPNYSYHNVAHIIHACAPATVKEFLLKNVHKSVGLVWNKLVKFHVQTILEVFDVTLAAIPDPFHKAGEWDALTSWAFSAPKALQRLLKNKKALDTLLDLSAKHPSIEFIPNTIHSNPVVKEGFYSTSLPSVIVNHAQTFMHACPDKTTDAFIRTVFRRFGVLMQMNSAVRSQFFSIRAPYHLQNKFIQHVLSIAESQGPLTNGDDEQFMQKLSNQIAYFNWNTRQLLTVANIMATYLLKRKPEVNKPSYHVWQQLWSSFNNQFILRFTAKLDKIYATGKKDKVQKTVKLMKKIAAYRQAIKTIIGTYYEPILQEVINGVKGDDINIRKANVTLDSHTNSIRTTDAHITKFVWERVKPSLNVLANDTRKDRPSTLQRVFRHSIKFAQNYLDSKRKAFVREEEDFAYNGIKEVFTYIQDKMYEELNSENMQQLFDVDIDLTFDKFFPKMREDPLANSSFLSSVFTRLSAEQKKAVYLWFKPDDLAHLVKNRTNAFITFVSNLPTELVNEAIVRALQTANAIDENTRNILVSYQDITDIKVRNSLQKMANSNNVSERTGALTSLVTSTARSKDLAQINKTLKFIREKIKNESADNRGEVLSILTSNSGTDYEEDEFSLFGDAQPSTKSKPEASMLIPKGFGEEQFGFWNDMLADALESPDLDTDVYDKTQFHNHPILSHFEKLGKLAIDHCTAHLGKHLDEKIFDFGAELLWKLHVFRHGEKKAAAEFELPFNGNKFVKSKTNEFGEPSYTVEQKIPFLRKVLGLYLAAYEKRLTLKNPEWKKSFKYVKNFTLECWQDVPEITAVTHAEVERVKAETKKDDDGLHIISSEDNFARVLENAQSVDIKYWHLAPVAEIIDVAMHSRLAPTVVAKWVSWKEHGAKKAREFKARKDQFVPELLKITPSAIHLRFVWRHLVTYMQDKLDDFIGKRKTFRGVFFVGPDQRKFDRSCLKTAATRRSGGREPVKKARGKKSTKAGIINADVSDPQKKVDEERAKEKAIEEELTFIEESKWDHEDFFYLEACFGLHRLLPRQVNVLAKDWEVQILSADRAVPYKVKATARWTIMPTIAYNDIVTFLNANENKNEVHNGLPVNIIESLLRGVMRNDEPTAPLNFLLAPKFLGSDRSRVSVYAIAQSVPYMPPDGLSNMLKLCLSGKRRQQLKISSYKEIIRLLAASPTDAHLDLIFHEWKRPDLHRDVRIAILTSAMSFLKSKDQRFLNIAWKILEHGATLSDQHEILTALLGTVRAGHNRVYFELDNSAYFKNSRILEHLDDLAKQQIVDEQAERYGTKVVGVIAKTAKNDDIKFLGVSSLFNWPNEELAIELSLAYLKDTSSNTMLYSTIPAEQSIFKARWISLVKNLTELCLRLPQRPEPLIELSKSICTRIATMDRKDRQQRCALIGLAHEYLNKLNGLIVKQDEILRPFKETAHNIFAVRLFEKRRETIALRGRAGENVLADSLSFLHDLTAFCSLYPTLANENNFYINQANNLLQDSSYIPLSDILVSLLELKVDTTNSEISKSPEYLYLLRRAAISIHSHIHAFARSSSANAQRLLKFWESVYAFQAAQKGLPREHAKASQAFSFNKIIEIITKVLRLRDKNTNAPPHYHAQSKALLVTLATRYADALENKTQDPFAKEVGDNLISGEDNFLFPETAPEDVLFRIVHATILANTEKSHDVVPKIIKALMDAHMVDRANKLIMSIIDNNLDKSKDWTKDQSYSNLCKSYGLRTIPLSPNFAEEYVEFVDKFEDNIIASLDSFELEGEYDKTIAAKVSKLIKIAESACRYKNSRRAAMQRLLKFLQKYISQTEAGVKHIGTPEQQAVRGLANFYIESYPNWIYQNYIELIPKLVDALIRDYSNQVLPKTDVTKKVDGLAKTLIGPSNTDHFNLTSHLKNLISAVIHMRLSDKPKDKRYTEITFDIAMALLTSSPSFVLHCPEDTYAFMNWAISLFIQEPDVQSLITNLTSITTNHGVLPTLAKADPHIPDLVKFITEIVDLKHQSRVLPQQRLLPLQAFPQYQHVSYSIALEMVKHFGEFLRLTKDREYVWRDEFVALLDRLSDVADPQIKRRAWDIETVAQKR